MISPKNCVSRANIIFSVFSLKFFFYNMLPRKKDCSLSNNRKKEILYQLVGILFCIKVSAVQLRDKSNGTMLAGVQVENVSTCVVREGYVNDFRVLLFSKKDSEELSVIFNANPDHSI